MTRETKLGLVVAGSFLALVGGVVSLKYAGKSAPTAPTQQENPAPGPQAGSAVAPGAGMGPNGGIQQVNMAEPKILPTEFNSPNPPLPEDLAPPVVGAPPLKAPTKIVTPSLENELPLAVSEPRKEDPKEPKITLRMPPKNSDPRKEPKEVVTPKIEADPSLILPEIVSAPPEFKSNDDKKRPNVPNDIDPVIVPPEKANTAIDKKRPNVPNDIDPVIIPPEKTNTVIDKKRFNVPNDIDPVIVPPEKTNSAIDKKQPKEPNVLDVPMIPALDVPMIGNDRKTPNDPKNIGIPINPPVDPKKNVRVEPKSNGLEMVAPPPPDANFQPANNGFKSIKPEQTTNSDSPIKNPMTGGNRPDPKGPSAVLDPDAKLSPVEAVVPVATKSDPPKQDNGYDEDIHALKPSETYAAISKQYYNSDAYASALQRYNRDTPGGLANNVRIPPIWVLEKKYPTDVAGSNSGTRSVGYQQPAVDLPRVNEPVYTVGDNGEMIGDIAKKTLGNDDYQTWQRIYTLNPQINPGKLIPGGTRLRLPDGTRTQ